MIMIILTVAAYLFIGMLYFTFTCESSKQVANPIHWLRAMLGWAFLMWRA
jgi:hypothetical protein